jgi:hypothetical protein
MNGKLCLKVVQEDGNGMIYPDKENGRPAEEFIAEFMGFIKTHPHTMKGVDTLELIQVTESEVITAVDISGLELEKEDNPLEDFVKALIGSLNVTNELEKLESALGSLLTKGDDDTAH